MPVRIHPQSNTPPRAHRSADLSNRLNAATAAKKAALERFHARPGPDDLAVKEQQAVRQAISDARDVRIAQREAARATVAARQTAEDAVKTAERAAHEAEERKSAGAAAARAVALDVDRKAAR